YLPHFCPVRPTEAAMPVPPKPLAPAAADKTTSVVPETLLYPVENAANCTAPASQGAAGAFNPEGPFPQAFGRYRVRESLGKGGMGTVFLADDTVLDIPVALKVPHA